jgi:hypothetical protein
MTISAKDAVTNRPYKDQRRRARAPEVKNRVTKRRTGFGIENKATGTTVTAIAMNRPPSQGPIASSHAGLIGRESRPTVNPIVSPTTTPRSPTSTVVRIRRTPGDNTSAEMVEELKRESLAGLVARYGVPMDAELPPPCTPRAGACARSVPGWGALARRWPSASPGRCHKVSRRPSGSPCFDTADEGGAGPRPDLVFEIPNQTSTG